jgi:suppressor for copper-sensitivity B
VRHVSTRRRARRVAALVAAVAALATPLAAQIARTQKARLALELAEVASGEARLAGVVTIDAGWHLQAHVPTFDYLIPTVLTLRLPPGAGAPELEYPRPVAYRFGFAEEELDVYEGTIRIPVRFRLPAGEGPFRIDGSLRYQACDDRSCLPPVETAASIELRRGGEGWIAAALEPPAELELADAAPARAGPDAPASAAAPAPAPRSLVAILLLALVGGLILNGMPCVLPILSLKVFGLVQAAGRSRASVRSGALATAAGILVSFWALAAAAIAARSAGAAVGWGVQFQQPGFVAFLAVVVLLFTLNLWGLFEIQLPRALARLADASTAGAGESGGHAGHFASGLFATLMATPCSAPFLGTALSFALGQSAPTIVATLTAVGAGLALPYLVLAVAPGAVRHLPRPGAWMDTLRGALGFLLAGALVWLLYVLAGQVAAEEVAFFELALLALGLALWFAHRSAPGGGGRRAGWAVAILLGIAGVALVARAPAATAPTLGATADGIAWRPFDRAEAERLARGGRLVFVDVTADWCVTCKVNERLVLNTPDVVAAFRSHDVVAMKADWTNRNDEIARYLAEHGRYGIPFYLLYRPAAPPHVFGELITRQGVVDVLEESASAAAATALRPAG